MLKYEKRWSGGGDVPKFPAPVYRKGQDRCTQGSREGDGLSGGPAEALFQRSDSDSWLLGSSLVLKHPGEGQQPPLATAVSIPAPGHQPAHLQAAAVPRAPSQTSDALMRCGRDKKDGEKGEAILLHPGEKLEDREAEGKAT